MVSETRSEEAYLYFQKDGTTPPKHYPEFLTKKREGWSSFHKPSDVEIYDIFELFDGTRVIVNEIRKIEKHAIHIHIWEFVDRGTGKMFHFHDIKTQFVED